MSNPPLVGSQQNYQYISPNYGPGPQGMQGGSYVIAPKYLKSKSECVDELSKILEELEKKDTYMRRLVEGHNNATLKKFSDDYDNLSQQILRTV